MLNCNLCEKPVPGEKGDCPDGDWKSGDWYESGNKYNCPHCGHINTARCDGEIARFII